MEKGREGRGGKGKEGRGRRKGRTGGAFPQIKIFDYTPAQDHLLSFETACVVIFTGSQSDNGLFINSV